jgi:hypothetical protein
MRLEASPDEEEIAVERLRRFVIYKTWQVIMQGAGAIINGRGVSGKGVNKRGGTTL